MTISASLHCSLSSIKQFFYAWLIIPFSSGYTQILQQSQNSNLNFTPAENLFLLLPWEDAIQYKYTSLLKGGSRHPYTCPRLTNHPISRLIKSVKTLFYSFPLAAFKFLLNTQTLFFSSSQWEDKNLFYLKEREKKINKTLPLTAFPSAKVPLLPFPSLLKLWIVCFLIINNSQIVTIWPPPYPLSWNDNMLSNLILWVFLLFFFFPSFWYQRPHPLPHNSTLALCDIILLCFFPQTYFSSSFSFYSLNLSILQGFTSIHLFPNLSSSQQSYVFPQQQ